MKATQPRLTQNLLLVISILFTGTCAATRLAAQSKAQGPVSNSARAAQAAKPTAVIQRITVTQGTTWRGPISLGKSVCAPHYISVRSGAEFFQFQLSTDFILVGRNIPLTLSVRVDATRLEPMVYSVPLTIRCLNCPRVKCSQDVTILTVAVEVVKPQGPAPTPTSQAEMEELSKNGPAIPATFAMKDFKLRAIFSWGWSLNFVYELAQPGTVTLTIFADGFESPLVYEFRGMNAGVHEELITIPDASVVQRPAALGAATYTIKAVTGDPPSEGVDPFVVLALTAGAPTSARPSGDRVSSPRDGFAAPQGACMTDASYGRSAASYRAGPPPSGIEPPTFAPREIRVAKGRPSAKASYSFRVTIPFNGGAQANVQMMSGGSSTQVSRQSFDRGLEAGETLSGVWDCMRDGSPSLGRHRLAVKAWYTAQRGGLWSLIYSRDTVLVGR